MANLFKYINGICQGRLTLTDGTAVTTSDVTAATTVYFDAYAGEFVSLYTGSAWVPYDIGSGLSIAVPATTDTMYDVFLDYADGTPALAATAWTNDTTRATALALQDGVYVKNGDTQQRYLGSFRTTGVSGQTEDSAANRFLWNYYNRVNRKLQSALETTDTWDYTTATLRQARASSANQLNFIIGVSEDSVFARVSASARNSTANIDRTVGIGLDSTSANASGAIMNNAGTTTAANAITNLWAEWSGYPGVGRHYIAWLEWSTATGTCTWGGDQGSPTLVQTGIWGSMRA